MRTRSRQLWLLLIIVVLIGVLAVLLLQGDEDDASSLPTETTAAKTDALPPDPGPAGDETLEGIDVNDNGVRDDVEIAIYERYPESPEKRSALEQSAKATQNAIVAGASTDEDAMFAVAEADGAFIDCLHERFDPFTSSEEIGFIENAVVNTPAREDAYENYNLTLSGNFFDVDLVENPCEG